MSSITRVKPTIPVVCYLFAVGIVCTAWLRAQPVGPMQDELGFAHAVPAQLAWESVKPEAFGSRNLTKEIWRGYHHHALPLAVGFFFLSFSGWSLFGVENIAIRKVT